MWLTCLSAACGFGISNALYDAGAFSFEWDAKPEGRYEVQGTAAPTSAWLHRAHLVAATNASDLYQESTNRYEQLIDAIACEGIWYDGDEGFDDWTHPRGYNIPTVIRRMIISHSLNSCF